MRDGRKTYRTAGRNSSENPDGKSRKILAKIPGKSGRNFRKTGGPFRDFHFPLSPLYTLEGRKTYTEILKKSKKNSGFCQLQSPESQSPSCFAAGQNFLKNFFIFWAPKVGKWDFRDSICPYRNYLCLFLSHLEGVKTGKICPEKKVARGENFHEKIRRRKSGKSNFGRPDFGTFYGKFYLECFDSAVSCFSAAATPPCCCHWWIRSQSAGSQSTDAKASKGNQRASSCSNRVRWPSRTRQW
ncbi:MAG: hypothetical protein ACFWT7_00055 [Succiniclasticum sp.]|jgi:hypothetical protein